MPFLVAALVTVLAVCGLLLAERSGLRVGVWLTKPAASLGFLAAARLAPAASSSFGQLVQLALLACAAGDVLLIPPGSGRAFLAGIVCFACGHLAYAVAFSAAGLSLPVAALGLVAMALVGALTLRWLAPHLPADMRVPVVVYIAVIALMVAGALGCSAASGDARLAVGALAFAASDLSVARDRFVRPGFDNVLWGLPLYYAAQLVLAWASAG